MYYQQHATQGKDIRGTVCYAIVQVAVAKGGVSVHPVQDISFAAMGDDKQLPHLACWEHDR